MDLYAYTQIDSLSELAKRNGISVPRLRGYRLMSEEKPLSEQEIQDIENNEIKSIYLDACTSYPRFCPESYYSIEFSWKTKQIKKKYLKGNGELRWNLIHGKRRKRIKLAIKHAKKTIRKQYETWNKYAGRSDVLYIHARIGGNNWNSCCGYLLEKEPWFLEKVDDSYDPTYCDIYAKISSK